MLQAAAPRAQEGMGVRERGSLIIYAVLAIAILGMLAGIGYKIRESGKESVRLEWAEANRAEKERQELERQERDKLTQKREADHAANISTLDRRYRAALVGVRNQSRPDGEAPSLSAAAVLIACPDRQADAAERLARLEEGVLGLLERGDRAIVRTETCRAWLTEQQAVK